jgi:phosphomannomutase
MADQFTFENVRLVADAIAVAARSLQPPSGIERDSLVVGFDRRFLSREFAQTVSERLAVAGYRVLLSDRPLPSQAISFTARHRKVVGGVMVTASHNPATYNGLKFKAWYAGSALPETYAAIAAAVGKNELREGGSIREANFIDDYIEGVRGQLDLALLRSSNVTILHDAIHGVSTGLPAAITGLPIHSIRTEVNPSFGGVNPEPIPENLAAAQEAVRAGAFDLAICNDGDADRLGILDDRGDFVSPHKIISLLALYLVREKKQSGELVKTFSTTRLIEKVATALGATLHETPIGFKYVADLMLSRDVLIGGEESGGIGFGRFMPERDGILSGLMVAEAVAHFGKPLSALVAAMEDEFGRLFYDRRDLHRPMDRCARLIDRVRSGDLDREFGLAFEKREETDGVKMNFVDGSWILFRKSGTEPIIRIYCESTSPEQVQAMLDRAVSELDA